MIKQHNIFIANLLGTLFFVSSSLSYAQKLPKIQQASRQAPNAIKIDGSSAEWNEGFAAKNVINRIYYTLSNDDENLYLVVEAADGFANEKAGVYGITLSISPAIEVAGKIKTSLQITYPINIEVRKKDAIRFAYNRLRKLEQDTTKKGKLKLDSVSSVINAYINTFFKEIAISGFKAIPEESLSIFNMNGIKVAAKVNEKRRYTYELALPLKYLGDLKNGSNKFNYRLSVNGQPDKSPGSSFSPPVLSVNEMDIDNAYVIYTTYLSGTYFLYRN